MNMIHEEASILPVNFLVQLECQVFMDRINKTLGSSLEESNGVPRELVRIFEDEWAVARARIIAKHTGKQFCSLVLIPFLSFYSVM